MNQFYRELFHGKVRTYIMHSLAIHAEFQNRRGLGCSLSHLFGEIGWQIYPLYPVFTHASDMQRLLYREFPETWVGFSTQYAVELSNQQFVPLYFDGNGAHILVKEIEGDEEVHLYRSSLILARTYLDVVFESPELAKRLFYMIWYYSAALSAFLYKAGFRIYGWSQRQPQSEIRLTYVPVLNATEILVGTWTGPNAESDLCKYVGLPAIEFVIGAFYLLNNDTMKGGPVIS